MFVNFKDICKKIHRTMEHVMSYFNAELGVACSLDPEGKLTFKGRFTPKQIESVVRKCDPFRAARTRCVSPCIAPPCVVSSLPRSCAARRLSGVALRARAGTCSRTCSARCASRSTRS